MGNDLAVLIIDNLPALINSSIQLAVFVGTQSVKLKIMVQQWLAKPPQKEFTLPDDVVLNNETERNTVKLNLRRKMQDANLTNLDPARAYNFGVAGESGAGKSTLVNRLRLLDDNSPSSARAGSVETTDEIHPYPHPDHPHVILWDIPGCNTESFPTKDYFLSQSLHAFDALIIVYAKRLLKSAIMLGKTAVKYGRLVVFVRTHADQDMRSIKDQHEQLSYENAAKSLRQQVEKHERVQLNECDLAQCKLFVVSSFGFFGGKSYPMDEIKLIAYLIATSFAERNTTVDEEQNIPTDANGSLR